MQPQGSSVWSMTGTVSNTAEPLKRNRPGKAGDAFRTNPDDTTFQTYRKKTGKTHFS